MKDAGFNLRKWISNSKQLMSQTEAQERANMSDQKVDYSVPYIGPDDQTFAQYIVGTGQTKLSGQVDEQKTLGLIWNYANDSFVFDLVGYANIAAELPLTKRSVLSVVARLLDPLGLLSPIIVPIKVLFQEFCVSKSGWDSPLNDTSSHKFPDWIHERRKVSHIVLPRCYFQNLCGNVIARYLCGFCDASIVAFAACTYLVIVTDQGLHSSLVATSLFCKISSLTSQKSSYNNIDYFRCHEAVGHNGVKEILMQLRSQYWIIKGRQTAKIIFSSVWFVEDMSGIRIHQSLCQIYQDFELKETLHFRLPELTLTVHYL